MRQSILVIILTGAGYDVLQSYSGTEALLLLGTATPDLILSDLMLPGMSGEQVLAKLRGELGSDIPVIILSAKDGITDKVGLLDGGADDYITKPFAPDEVLARVRVVLRRRKKSAPEEALVCRNIAVYPEPERCSRASGCTRRSGRTATTAPITRSTSTSATCAKSSKKRTPMRSISSRCTASDSAL